MRLRHQRCSFIGILLLGSWERHQAVCQAPQRGNALNVGNGDQHCTFLMQKANAAEAVTPEDRDAASKAEKDQPFESSISALDETQRSKVSSCKSICNSIRLDSE
ncbi:unnamed protein product [Sphagnum jensenii]|uniref:Secreted protein n=1 Tax=Sphagnum jensenii TaxID=128206 RepID=A0ABP1A7Z2_9BRYO